jgi:putative oxidoreductase
MFECEAPSGKHPFGVLKTQTMLGQGGAVLRFIPFAFSIPIVTPCVVTSVTSSPAAVGILLVRASKAGNIFAWILAIFLAMLLIYVGGVKLIRSRGPMVQEFAQIGLGQWFRYFTGVLEVTGGIGLLIPKFRFWAALQIALVMVGATAANLTVLHSPASRCTAGPGAHSRMGAMLPRLIDHRLTGGTLP